MEQKTDNNRSMERKAVAYLRKSTEEQSNYSILWQKQCCQKEAQTRGFNLPEENIFIDDGYSSKTVTTRPALVKMLGVCSLKKNNIVALLIFKIDRLSRETSDYLGLRKVLGGQGINIVSCTEPTDDSPAGEFIETILAAAAKYDNMLRGERAKAGMLLRVKDGLPNGRAPLGFKNVTLPNGDRIIETDPSSFNFVREAWYKMTLGTSSLEDIAQYLNSNKVTILYGKKRIPVSKQSVSKMFANRFYCGFAVSKRHGLEVKSNKFSQMVPEDAWYRVRHILIARNNLPTLYQKLRPEFPVRGYLICPICHQPMRAGMAKGRSKYYGYYWCEDHPTPSISSDKIDDKMLELLRSLTPDDLTKKLFIEDCKRKWNEQYRPLVHQQCTVEDDIGELKELKHMIAKKNYTGVLDDELAREEIKRVDIEITAKQTILSESKLGVKDIEVTAAFMNGFLEDLGKVYLQEKNLELKRYLIGSIFPKKLTFRNGNLEPLELSPSFQLIRDIITSPDHLVDICGSERT